MSEWAAEYFEHGYAQRWRLDAPSDQIRREAAGLWTRLGLASGHCVIDVGCGHGKYALALAAEGARVIGLDFAASLVERAQRLAGELEIPADWVRGDMRRLPFRRDCADAAILADAFGFFPTDDDDETVLCEIARVLKDGGRLAIKVINGAVVLADFRPAEREERNGVVVVVANTLTLDPPRLTQRLSISGSRGVGQYERRQRLYRVEEMCDALDRVGVTVLGVFADPFGAPFEVAASSSMWLMGTKGRKSTL